MTYEERKEHDARMDRLGEIDRQAQRIAELERICAESYQVVGILAQGVGSAHVDKALDNLSQQKLVHGDVLPFLAVGIVARIADLEAALAKSKAMVTAIGEQLEADRTAVAMCMTVANRAIDQKHWLTEGRGPYEWNDDNWHKEFYAAAVEIKESISPLTKIAANWRGCPQTTEEVAQARVDLKAALAERTKERDAWMAMCNEQGRAHKVQKYALGQERDALVASLEEAKYLLTMPAACCGQAWDDRVRALASPSTILSDRLAAERKAVYDECFKIALGCQDYGGGCRADKTLLKAFHHGMQTVANVIKARMKDPSDFQARVVLGIGAQLESGEVKP